jgi:hypothetical protein
MSYKKIADKGMMKKLLITSMYCLFLAFFMPEMLHANIGVSGNCSYCHSMDLSDCISCHGQNPSGTQALIPVPDGGPIPQVLHHMVGGDLAGGNFYYAADGYGSVPSTGHAVSGITNQKPAPMNMPPGFVSNVNLPNGGTGPASWSQQLYCAGTFGCHGDRTVSDPLSSVLGSHHNSNPIDGLTSGTSYRFLSGVTGAEQPNWEYQANQATINSHNGYQGSYNYSSMNTISYFCGGCHVTFHPNSNLGGTPSVGSSSSAWIRHPVDINFGSVAGGYNGSEFQGYTTYSFDTPVAFLNPVGNETTVDMNSIVMCLSCHRPHATAYENMLRWDGTLQTTAGSAIGCDNCHTQK